MNAAEAARAGEPRPSRRRPAVADEPPVEALALSPPAGSTPAPSGPEIATADPRPKGVRRKGAAAAAAAARTGVPTVTVPIPAAERPADPAPADPPPDDWLIRRSRAGDQVAFATLYSRHAAAARQLATYLCDGPADAEDLVAESFERVLKALRGGSGPTEAFRPYLLRVLRNRAIERSRAARRLELVGEPAEFDRLLAEEHVDVLLQQLEESFAARAYARLPERWQAVLWHIQVEGASPAEIAPLLGMSPNAVAALAYRAREGLREAYLQVHVVEQADPSCRATHDQLGAYARGGLRPRDRRRVEGHLDVCKSCRRAVAELTDVNATLRAWVAPLVLGALAAQHAGHSAVFGAKMIGLAGWMTSRVPQPSGRSSALAGSAAAATAASAGAAVSAAATATATATMSVALVAGVAGVSIGVGTVIDTGHSGSQQVVSAAPVGPRARLATAASPSPTVSASPSASPSAAAASTAPAPAATDPVAAVEVPAPPPPAGATAVTKPPTTDPSPAAEVPAVADSPAVTDPTGAPTTPPAAPATTQSPAAPDPTPSAGATDGPPAAGAPAAAPPGGAGSGSAEGATTTVTGVADSSVGAVATVVPSAAEVAAAIRAIVAAAIGAHRPV